MDQPSPDIESDRKTELRTRLAALLERVSAVRTTLPGKPRPAREAENEWRSARAELVSRYDNPTGMALIFDFIDGSAEEMHRWRIELDCGHIHEVLMHYDEWPPLGPWKAGPLGAYAEGTYPCTKDCKDPPWPAREITEWNTRREHTFEADPEEPPDWYAGCFNPRSSAAAAWAERRHPEPYAKAFWNVTLSCGHAYNRVLTDADWKPEDGISRQPRPDTDSQRRRRHQEILDNEQVDEDTKARIRDGCPTPDPMQDCPMCAWSRQITAYEYVGPLVPPPPPPRKPRKPVDPRVALKRRLREAERDAKLLRAEMAALDSAGADEGGR
jgi:hypothetical protein